MWPYMAHPIDAIAREQYEAYLLAKLQHEGGVTVSSETVSQLLAGIECSSPANALQNAAPGGCMAGEVLLARLEMDEAKIAHAGIDKACHVVSEHYGALKGKKGFFTGDGQFKKASRETVLDNWNKYKSVSHLWAAYLILLREAERLGDRDNPALWLNGHKVASIAAALKSRALRVITSPSSPALLSDAIEIEGAKPIAIEIPALTVDFFEVLYSFVSRRKTSE